MKYNIRFGEMVLIKETEELFFRMVLFEVDLVILPHDHRIGEREDEEE